jgi:hypothetical protein
MLGYYDGYGNNPARPVTLGKRKATTCRDQYGYTVIRYYDTDIVEFNGTEVFLHTGGFNTASTVRRMNQASKEFGLDFTVRRIDGRLYVTYGNEKVNGAKFFDGDNARIVRA